MRKSIVIAFLGLSLIITGMVTADAGPTSGSFKIGFVDLEQVLTQTAAGQRAIKELEKERKARQAKLDKQKKDLLAYREQLDKQKSILKPNVRRQREEVFQKRYVELQQTLVKLERELAEKQTKLIRQIMKKAGPVVKSIAKEGGYDMIVDRAAVVWSDEAYDLTNKIKQRVK